MSESIPEFDPYAALGVPRDAQPAVVAAAHRALIRHVHPDRSRDPDSSERSKRLNVARDWLLDPARRARYDAAHPIAPSRPRARSTIPRASRERSWWRSPDRAELEVFVARCRFLTRAEMSRLVAEDRATRVSVEAAVGAAMSMATTLGRQAVAVASARLAFAHATDTRPRAHPRLAEILRYTALGFAVSDRARQEAAVLLRPWRDAIDRPDARAAARRVRLARARQLIRRVLFTTVVVVVSGLTVVGLLVALGVVLGWVP
jgi:hypothetical protein